MNILVLGGSNFIGWKLLAVLGQTGHRVTVFNRGNQQRQYPKNVVHHIVDRRDEKQLASALGSEQFDVAYDMCGYVEDDMVHVLKILRGRVGKYVFVSTAATYADPFLLPLTEEAKQGVHSRWGAYGAAKLACERMLLSAHEHSSSPCVIVRPSYVYGVGNSINREAFIFDRISKGRTLLLPSGGEAIMQLGEVGDLCQALYLLAEHHVASGECYNISGSELVTLSGLVQLISDIMGADFQTVTVNPQAHGVTDRDIFPFDNCSYFTTSQKFSNQFGWKPQVSLRAGLEATYADWLRASKRLLNDYEKEDTVLANIRSG